MARYTKRQYKLQVTAVMVVYFLLMFFEWPLVLNTPPGWERALLAVVPALPLIVVVGLLARYVIHADELEQRINLIALSIATGVVSAASGILGFLAFADALDLGGQVIFWVFPALLATYGIARIAIVHRYTGSWTYWAC